MRGVILGWSSRYIGMYLIDPDGLGSEIIEVHQGCVSGEIRTFLAGSEIFSPDQDPYLALYPVHEVVKKSI